MSDRRMGATDHKARDWQRQIEDRIWRLENGGATAGQLSLADTLVIGTVEIQVVPTGGGNVNLTFRNTTTGATSTVIL